MTGAQRCPQQWHQSCHMAPEGAGGACVSGCTLLLALPGCSAFSPFPKALMNLVLILHFFPYEPQ